MAPDARFNTGNWPMARQYHAWLLCAESECHPARLALKVRRSTVVLMI